MKKSISVILLLLVLTAFQCGKECCVVGPCSEVVSLTGTWKLAYYKNGSTSVIDSMPITDGEEVIFAFKDNEKTGTIAGKTFVNTVEGEYEMLEYCRIKVTSFGGTKVGEPDWSAKAWLESNATYHYKILGAELQIQRYQGTDIMVFKKV